MKCELDHIFICVSCSGEEAGRLSEFGLTEGMSNTHPGQGTACRRFFFANCYLELLWVSDAAEAQSATTRPMHLWERWNDRASGACPFGMGFRPGNQPDGGFSFSSWEYRPSYLPAPLCMHVATNADVVTEPLLFYLSFARRADSYPPEKRPPLLHRARLREVTRVELTSPHAESLSVELAAVTSAGPVQLRVGTQYVVELGFDGESQGQAADFRPLLPVRFCW
ncbi:MAG TPA: VOC family protein [Candidatus Limnocylindrales bacterium]|jgi:hypothetical protein|nr:VOC family protein [Candidatus Limnocylindrales bacterium]